MLTHYLGAEQVRAYVYDLSVRLLEHSLPKVWFALSHSGQEIAELLAERLPKDVQRRPLGFTVQPSWCDPLGRI